MTHLAKIRAHKVAKQKLLIWQITKITHSINDQWEYRTLQPEERTDVSDKLFRDDLKPMDCETCIQQQLPDTKTTNLKLSKMSGKKNRGKHKWHKNSFRIFPYIEN